MERLCPCGQPAVYRFEKITRGGAIDPRVGIQVGTWYSTYWCVEHAAVLVAQTGERYRINQLTAIPRGTRGPEGQQSWDFSGM